MLMPRTAASLQRAFRKPNAVVLQTRRKGHTQLQHRDFLMCSGSADQAQTSEGYSSTVITSRAFHEAMLMPPKRHKRAINPDSLLPNMRKKQLTHDMTLEPAIQREEGGPHIVQLPEPAKQKGAVALDKGGEEGEDTVDGERDEERLTTPNPVGQSSPEEGPNHHPKAHILLSAGEDKANHKDLDTIRHESQTQDKVQGPLELPVTALL
ncbi:hypothetical protein INR49_002488 [Caranx melampygus]|nr:hypothetical protein INR49_002488 [Caranx melampygus]